MDQHHTQRQYMGNQSNIHRQKNKNANRQANTTRTENVCRKLLYPERTVDNTMILTLNELLIVATKGTQSTTRSLTHFLNYCASNLDSGIIYQKSDMILTVDSDAACLVA